ncbi:MAG: nucleotide exchange factor GrpE [Spirochaetaceae bacterium]|jgi:molecular chaperone GrpE (heat shock protein)|nr:nucleotide exchange factor GrpE [Spirochaetaceae bacterium]
MLNFEDELARLLSRETERLPRYECVELAAAGRELLAELNRKQADVSLQIEEIYDLVKEQDTRGLREMTESEKNRADQLVFAAIGLSDLLDDFCAYARRSGNEELQHQAGLLRESANSILSARGILCFGAAGQPLDPRIHTVKASAESSLPREQVVEVLQNGYAYRNVLLRKAAVVVSRGPEPAEEEAEDAGIGDQYGYTEDWHEDETGYRDEGENEATDIQDTDGIDDDIQDQNEGGWNS